MTEDPFQRLYKQYTLARRDFKHAEIFFFLQALQKAVISQLQLSIIRVPVSNPDELMGPSTGLGWNLWLIIVLSPRKIM